MIFKFMFVENVDEKAAVRMMLEKIGWVTPDGRATKKARFEYPDELIELLGGEDARFAVERGGTGWLKRKVVGLVNQNPPRAGWHK
ncbi:MAG: hypothetical protein G01um101416_1002 [Microgenomates group bacterium Gr01-1014_16]|nr:MAG: hypothetical protein G01um101416_1002 [Microgenomates group bacterium Gr01-1014_16]